MPRFVVEHLVGESIRDVSVRVDSGEILGVYGLVGSGRSRFLRTVFGLEHFTGGTIELSGRPFRPRSPRSAIESGVAYLSEDRKVDGLVPQLSARTNLPLPVLDRFTRGGVLRRRALAAASRASLDATGVRGDVDAPAGQLSGGNQQKVLFGRVAIQQPVLLLLDEPTKGVDIGAKAEIHRLVRDLARDRGVAVLVVSSEEEELIGLADRITIFHAGTCDGVTYPSSALSVSALRRLAWSDANPTDLAHGA